MQSLRLTLLFLFALAGLGAQTPDTPLTPGNLNILYLDQLVKEGIDSVRTANGLLPLRNDSVLFVAAQDHADYLNRNKMLSHFEEDIPEKHAPADRVRFHGGADFSGVGENVETNYLLTPLKLKYAPSGSSPAVYSTYGELANGIVLGWVHSPPHYKNILTAEYEYTGVAVSYNPEDNSVRAVQVFGMRPYYKAGKEDSLIFPYSSYVPPPVITGFDQVSHTPHSDVHAWKLRAPADSAKTCTDCWAEGFAPGSTHIEVKDGKAIFYTEDAGIMKRLLNNRKDGLAIELVPYKTYDCGNPKYYTKASRRNGQCIFSGRVLKPLYRKKLKRGFKKKTHHSFRESLQEARTAMKADTTAHDKFRSLHDAFVFRFDAQVFTMVLGKVPKDMTDGYYEVNVVVIQKKQVCRVIHFTSFCGEEWDVEKPMVNIVQFSADTFRLEPKAKVYSFVIPFEQGKTEYRLKDIQPFLDSISGSKFIVDSAFVNAFASVEGSEALNRRLQEQRASSILSAMQSTQHDTIATIVKSEENWTLFDKQLKSVPAFSVFKGKTHEEIKAMLANDTALAKRAEPWLAKERMAVVRLKVRLVFEPQNNCEWLTTHFKTYRDSAEFAKHADLRPFFLDSLSDLHAWYYHQLLNGSGDTSCLRKIGFPEKQPFDTLAYNQAWMMRHLLPQKDTLMADNAFYRQCISIGNAARLPYWPAVYAWTSLDVKYWTEANCWSGDPEKTLAWINWLKTDVPDSMQEPLSSLEISWHYKAVNYYEAKGKAKRPQVLRSLAAIVSYWSDSSRYSDSIALKLSNYLLLHKQADWAYAILWPAAQKPDPRHDVLMQFLKLSYVHVEESPDFSSYYQMVSWAQTYLTHEEWCSIFIGPCNISFQLWDSEGMRNLYCEECATWKNYARDPEKWKKK